jgi:transcriptional regulator with XRE-family HTH domain
MISAQQIRAARGMMGWSQTDLATQVGITQRALTSIETGKSRASFTTLESIEKIFEAAGIEFIEDGVRKRKDRFHIISGPDFAKETRAYILNKIKELGQSEILLYGVEPSLLGPAAFAATVQAVEDIYATGTTQRVITVQDLPHDCIIGDINRYRGLPRSYFSNTNPIHVIGDYVILMMFDLAETWVIHNAAFAVTQTKIFEGLWAIGTPLSRPE